MESIYKLITPPFQTTFGSMSKDDVKKYFQWFIEQIPERVELLRLYVQNTRGYEEWRANFKPQSLVLLGKWFCEHVETRQRSRRDKENIYQNSPSWYRSFRIPDDELSNSTFSLAIDIGMYLGRTMEINVPDLVWQPLLKPKNSVDYQHPVIVGKGSVPLNPVRILVTYAYGISQGSKRPERLLELYEIWAGLLANE